MRGPEWSYDGTKLIFAARARRARAASICGCSTWRAGPAGSSPATAAAWQDGVRVHNFDPVFAPDGSVVFASTRAGTLTLKNLLPNATCSASGPALDFANPEQMTFLLNSELVAGVHAGRPRQLHGREGDARRSISCRAAA